MRGERFRGRKFTFKRDPSKKESSSHGDKEKWEEKRELTCFKCKKPGHIKYDCPLYKSEAKRRMKKAMMALGVKVKNLPNKKMRRKWQTCASWQ
ncbi:hypothetical protein CK203_076951 [Vitis vinifera]|uniref:CCHC-type domain-containing protein n=1 Tax=Vitis vinifera TaxID=29760 RepID=A0A438DZY9_VITVI|nr:hypothetical protein CK203_076951 [Vitis vinifera]